MPIVDAHPEPGLNALGLNRNLELDGYATHKTVAGLTGRDAVCILHRHRSPRRPMSG